MGERTMEMNRYEKWARDRVTSWGLSRELGMEILECHEGYCRGRIVLEDKHENPYGWVHGGCMMALADTVAGIAAGTAGSYISTLDSNFHFLKKGTETKEIICTASRIRDGRRILVYEAEITNDSGELLAKGDFTFYSMGKEIAELQ